MVSLGKWNAFFKTKWWKGHDLPYFYTGSSISLALAQLLAGIAMVRWIDPGELGIWHSLRLALTYSFFLLAGIINGLSRELPFSLGNNDLQKAKNYAGTAFYYIVICCILILIGGVASLLVFRDQDYNILGGICAVTALTVFSFYRNYLIVTFRSKNSFQSLARIQLYEAVLTVATIPLLVYMLYEGLLIRAVLVEAIILFLLYRVRPFKVSAVWDKASFKELMRTGAPIFALDYIGSTARTFDRVALLRCGGFQEVGYYALAATAYGAFSTIPMSIAQYLYPRMSYSYGRDNDPAHLWRMAWKTGAIIIVIMFPIACLGWYIIPPVVQSFFPQYVNGTDAARIMVFSAVLTGAAVGVNALWSMKAWKYMAIYQILISGLYAIAPFIGIAFCAYPVTGVAYGLLGASSVTFGLAIALTYTATHGRRPILK